MSPGLYASPSCTLCIRLRPFFDLLFSSMTFPENEFETLDEYSAPPLECDPPEACEEVLRDENYFQEFPVESFTHRRLPSALTAFADP